MTINIKACPIIQQTADGVNVGRCYYYTGDNGLCPIHGDVSKQIQIYKDTGKLTLEKDFRSACK